MFFRSVILEERPLVRRRILSELARLLGSLGASRRGATNKGQPLGRVKLVHNSPHFLPLERPHSPQEALLPDGAGYVANRPDRPAACPVVFVVLIVLFVLLVQNLRETDATYNCSRLISAFLFGAPPLGGKDPLCRSFASREAFPSQG